MKYIVFSLFPVFFLMCSNKESAAASRGSMDKNVYTEEAVEEASEASLEEQAIDYSKAFKVTPKIIKTGHLTLESQDLNNTKKEVNKLNKTYQASVTNLEEGTGYNSLTLNYTIKIPAQNFDAWIEDVSKIYSYFEHKNITSEDVTEEYLDVETRLKNKKALETRYLELLKKANTIAEILEIEKEINNIRVDIEAQEGRLKYLKDKVAYSTIYLSVYKSVPSMNHVKESYFSRILDAIKGGWNFMLNIFLGLFYAWPLLIIVIFVVIFIKKKQKRKLINENEVK